MGFGYAPGGGVFLLGPFNTFDARLRLVQTVLDLSARNTARSRSEEERSASLRVSLAGEQVSAAAALAYLEVLRSSAAVNSAASGLALASGLRSLAEGKHDAARSKQLFERDDVSRQVYEKAVADAEVLKARAELAAKKVSAAEMDLSYTRLTAPEAGKVTKKNAELRAFVQVGQPLMAIVTDQA